MPDATTVVIENPAGVDGAIPGQDQSPQPAEQQNSNPRSRVGTLPRGPIRLGKTPVTPASGQQPVEPDARSYKYRRVDLTDNVPNLQVTRNGDRERTGQVAPPEYIYISGTIMDGLRGAVEEYTKNLLDMQKDIVDVGGKKMNAYEAMKMEQEAGGDAMRYLEDKYMLDLFAPKDPQTGERVLKDAQGITDVIANSAAVLDAVSRVAERRGRDLIAAMGMRAEMRAPGARPNIGRLSKDTFDTEIDFPIDQGPLNATARRALNWAFEPHNTGGRGDPGVARWRQIAGIVRYGARYGAAAGAIAGAAGAGLNADLGTAVAASVVAGAEAGALGALLAPVVAHVANRLGRNGPRLALVLDADVLTQSQRPEFLRRAQEFLGVDPTDLIHSNNLEVAMEQAIGMFYLRTGLLQELGVNPKNLDAFSDQKLHIPGQPTESLGGAHMNRDVNNEFRRLGGWAGGLSLDEQRDMLRQAEQSVLVRRFREAIEQPVQRPQIDDGQRLINGVTKRTVGESQTEAAIAKERRKEYADRIQGLTADKSSLTTLTSPDGAINKYLGKIQTAEQARKDLATILSRIQQTGVGSATSYTEAIRMLDDVLTLSAIIPAGAPAGARVAAPILIPDISGNQIPVGSLIDREASINGEKADKIATARAPQPGETPEQTKARFDSEKSDIEARYREKINLEVGSLRTRINQVKNELERLQTAVAPAEEQAVASTEARSVAKILTDTQTAYASATAAGPLAPDYASVIQEMNLLYAANPALGWPESENNDVTHRMLVRNALIQARMDTAMRAEIPNFANLSASFDAVTNLAAPTRRITPEQLRALTPDELVALDAERAGAGGIATTRLDLTNAKRWAQAQVDYLQRSIQDETANVDTDILTQQRLSNNINVDREREQLEVVKGIYDRKEGKIQSWARSAYRDDDGARLRDRRRLVQGEDGLTASEVTAGLPRNVLEIIQILTDYQNSSEGRNEAFNKIWTSIGGNPDLLLRLLNNSYSEVLGGRRNNINAFSLLLRNASASDIFLESEFSRATQDLADQFITWSKSI